MTSPKVSVIVPVYNAEEWLPGSFCSFEEQSYSNIEWVLVDDGSTDESAGLCAEWCSADIARRRFVHKENGGASSARNAGLNVAMGEYVLFWDSDDEQDPMTVEKMVESLPGPDGVVVCAIRRVLPDGSWRNIFTCERHIATPRASVDEWLGGGCQRALIRSLYRGACLSKTVSGSRRVSSTRTFCGRRRF